MPPLQIHRVFIGLGSNLGKREENIRRALSWMEDQEGVQLKAVSALRQTQPWGVTDQPSFVNAAAIIETSLSPGALLALLKVGESALGRAPNARRWGPRVIDLDILLFGEQTIQSEDLVIPHPQLTNRSFVMEQIVELDPAALHPPSGRTVLSLLGESDSSKI